MVMLPLAVPMAFIFTNLASVQPNSGSAIPGRRRAPGDHLHVVEQGQVGILHQQVALDPLDVEIALPFRRPGAVGVMANETVCSRITKRLVKGAEIKPNKPKEWAKRGGGALFHETLQCKATDPVYRKVLGRRPVNSWIQVFTSLGNWSIV